MKKIPWGIIMGVCAMFVFFLTVGVIAVYILLNGIAAQTNEVASFFGEWYQVVMFVFDILFFLGFVGSVVLYVLRETGKLDKEEVSE